MIREKFKGLLIQNLRFSKDFGHRFSKILEKFFNDFASVQALGLWTAAVVTGIVAVFYAKAFRHAEMLASQLIASEPQLFFVLTPFLFLTAWWLVYRFSPEAGGSGIPQVMAAVDGKSAGFATRLLSLRMVGVKVLSSLLCVVGGGAIGREGPTLQISAGIFHSIGKYIRKYYPQSNEKIWIITGAASGLASAFNTPLGGIVYAVEELGGKHFHSMRTTLISAVIVSGLVAQSLVGRYLYLGYPQLQTVVPSQWIFVILTGVISGSLGSLFAKLVFSVSRMRKEIQSPMKLAFVAFIVGLLAAILIWFAPHALGSGNEVISEILFKGEVADLSLIITRFAGTCLAYFSGAAGGIFSPSLAIGATIGSYVASLFHTENANLFAMLGMIGFLTGVTHTPFTSFILVMEMSDHHSAIFPMMISALLANSVAKAISEKSFYERVKDQWLRMEENS